MFFLFSVTNVKLLNIVFCCLCFVIFSILTELADCKP